MSFITQNGLIIRLDAEKAFDAMEHAKSGTPADVLLTTEKLFLAPSGLALFAGIGALSAGLETWEVVLAMTTAIALPRVLYSWIPGVTYILSGLRTPLLRLATGIFFGYIDRGWTGSIIFLVGATAVFVTTLVVYAIMAFVNCRLPPERSFLLACRYHGVPRERIDELLDG